MNTIFEMTGLDFIDWIINHPLTMAYIKLTIDAKDGIK